jgi:radical SAM enzyme (rSAM/lipoprotein system)
MPLEDFIRVLDSIAAKTDSRQVFIIITGGEPLVREDIVECCRAIRDHGFPWGMVTNGLYLTPELLHQLVDAGMHAMTISLDGLEENHNWMRGNKDSFRAVSDAIDLLREEPNIVWDIVTCATEHNFSELPALRDFLIDKGVPSWRLLDVFPVGRAAKTPEVLLSDKHYRQLLEFIRETRRKGSIRTAYGCEGFVGEYELDVRDYGFFCKAGITVGSVLIDGSISACSSIRSDYHQGNIYEDDFMDVWENRFLLYRDRKWMHKEDCGECNMFRYCKGSGMHLRDGDGKLLQCHVQRLLRTEHP